MMHGQKNIKLLKYDINFVAHVALFVSL